MLITPAFAQGVGGAGAPDLLMSVLPFVLIFVIINLVVDIFYSLLDPRVRLSEIKS